MVCIFTQDPRSLVYWDLVFHLRSLLASMAQDQRSRERIRSSDAISHHPRNAACTEERNRKRLIAREVSVYLTQASKTRSRTPSETRRRRSCSSSSRTLFLSVMLANKALRQFILLRLRKRETNARTLRTRATVSRQATKLWATTRVFPHAVLRRMIACHFFLCEKPRKADCIISTAALRWRSTRGQRLHHQFWITLLASRILP